MIKDDETLSHTAKKFYTLLQDNASDLLGFMSIVTPTDEFPYIEPGSIVIQIPAREGFLFDKIYAETRKDDILIVMGNVVNRHISWWSEDTMDQQMKAAIQLIENVINEQVIFVKRRVLFGKREFFEDICVEELEKVKRVLAVYSWKGTYDQIVQ